MEIGSNKTKKIWTIGLVDRIANYRNSISRWRKKNLLPCQANIAALKVALEEANNDDSISHDEIRDIDKKLQEAYREDE